MKMDVAPATPMIMPRLRATAMTPPATPCWAGGAEPIKALELGDMKIPVLAYVIVILTMAWQAWERQRVVGGRAAWLGFLGAALFVLSDSFLAVNRFRGAFDSARLLTLSTYYAAQWLIASSIG